MARGGITQTEVSDARKRLINSGKNPSIDAIRSELGNTGSKTTISRHLKEIEQREHVQHAGEAFLSVPIKQLISQIAQQLKLEANSEIEKQAEIHSREMKQAQQALKKSQEDLTEAQNLSAEVNEALNLEQEKNTDLAERLTQTQQQLAYQKQESEHLKQALAKSQTHCESLEEKHQHARESLEHYRTSVKDQRDQDIRRHDQQVQQLQVEQRQLQQTLVIKQDELTQAKAEQTRLFTELSEARKKFEREQAAYKAEKSEHLALIANHEKVKSELSYTKLQLDIAETKAVQIDNNVQKISELEIELATKNDLLAQLKPLLTPDNKTNDPVE